MQNRSNQMIQPSEFNTKALEPMVEDQDFIVVQQVKEWAEIIVDFETRNKYQVQTESGEKLGMVIERGGGFMAHILRWILRSHRPLEVDVYDNNNKLILHLSRKFFFFFSDLLLTGPDGTSVGSIHRRFGIIYKKYDLMDQNQIIFARIKAPLWRLWTFQMYDLLGNRCGVITKRWQGFLKEVFTDADRFVVSMKNAKWDTYKKAVVLCAAVSIDFDFFEENQGKSDGLIG